MPVHPRTVFALAATAVLCVGLSGLGSVAAHAAGEVFVVDQGTVSFTSEPGELGWAIEQSNSTPGPDTIDIRVDTIQLGNNLPGIDDEVTILGNGATIDGNSNGYSAFAIWGASASITDLSIVAPNSSGVYASPAAGDSIVLTDVNVSGASSYPGLGLAADVDSTIQVNGGTMSGNNVGMEISGWSGGTVEVTGTELVGNAATGVQVTSSGDTVILLENVAVVGEGTTQTGVEAVQFGNSELAVRSTVISGNVRGMYATVYDDSTLELTNGTDVSDNAQEGVYIFASGTVLIDETTISQNGREDDSAGIEISEVYDEGSLTISRSTISGNHGHGATAYVFDDAALDIVNSTISSNAGDGLVVESHAGFRLRHSTITDNAGSGVRLDSDADGALVTHTIAASNRTAGIGDSDLALAGTSVTVEWSMIGSVADEMNLVEGDGVQWNVTAPGLEPLADNGGPTLTHLLADDSPALDAGDISVADIPATDQRDFARTWGESIDIGALEVQPDAPVNPIPAPDEPAVLAATGAESSVGWAGALSLLAIGLLLVIYRSARTTVGRTPRSATTSRS